MKAFQDLIPDNHCFGCGPRNSNGLRIKSVWSRSDESVCRFTPSPAHSAGPTGYLNGGIMATIIDCHCVCTAIANGYRTAGRNIGEGERIWFATGGLEIRYRLPVAIDQLVTLKARVKEAMTKKTVLECTLHSRDQLCAEAKVVAVRVPSRWFRSGTLGSGI